MNSRRTSSFNFVLNRWFNYLTMSPVVDSEYAYSVCSGSGFLLWGVVGCRDPVCAVVGAPASPWSAGAHLPRFLDLSKNNLHRKLPLAVGSVF